MFKLASEPRNAKAVDKATYTQKLNRILNKNKLIRRTRVHRIALKWFGYEVNKISEEEGGKEMIL